MRQLENESPIVLSDTMLGIWSSMGPHFHSKYEIDNDGGREKFIYWLLSASDCQFPGIKAEIQFELLNSLHRCTMVDGGIPLTRMLEIIYKFRNDICFDGTGDVLKRQIWEWFIAGGFRDYDLPTCFPTLEGGDIYKVFSFQGSDDLIPTPILAKFLHSLFSGVSIQEDNPKKIVDWFYSVGLSIVEHIQNPFGKEVLSILRAWNELFRPSNGFPIWWDLLYKLNNQLNFTDEDENINVAPEIKKWWLEFGSLKYSKVDKALGGSLDRFDEIVFAVNKLTPRKKDEISLIGYPKGGFGLGEDMRLLNESLSLAGLKVSLYSKKDPVPGRESIDVMSTELSRSNGLGETIFYVMPAFDTQALFFEYGRDFFSGGKRIGFWQWELSEFPREAVYAFNLVDEIWCHSLHSLSAFEGIASDKKIIRVPLPVSVPNILCEENPGKILPTIFTFFSSFDGSSGIARKNPLAVIDSFQRAFPRAEKDVRLILKVMRQKNTSLWRECLSRISIDSRILIIDESLDRSEYYKLLRGADAVISLHRAEGFGRLMAEAMAYGIPVIASNYSGNLDYMNSENSWLVPGDVIPVLKGDYPFHDGKKWFSVDIGEAAKMMRECRESSTLRSQKGLLAKIKIEQEYSPIACSKFYQSILDSKNG
jgi:glycosyltransferase involved in cell wall biosynthesis